MFVRNLLQAGDFVTLVPVGIPVTLQYSEKSTLQKVYQNHNPAGRVELSNDVIEHLIKSKQVPTKVPIKGGTTWIHGVLYKDILPQGSGDLPDCIFDKLLDMYIEDPDSFTFYAGNVESLAQKFNGPVAARQWLNIALFNTLPGYLVSAELNEDSFEAMVSRDYPFRYPLISSYIVFRGDNVLYMPTGLTEIVVKDMKRVVNESGIISAEITSEDDVSYRVSYSDVVKFNAVSGTVIVANSDGRFIYSEADVNPADVLGDSITCSWCGKKLIVPKTASLSFKCSDPQCNSVLYPRVRQLLSELELDVLTYDEYVEVAKKIGNIFSLPDLFDLDKYKDVKLSVTLAQVVRAVIPKFVLPGIVQISQLCDACNNSADTVIYYMQHVDKLKTELGLDIHTFTRLYRWLLNPENASDVVEILKLDNISYISSMCKFEGAPVFRDKTIFITGTFKHGGLADIVAILSSYSAKVVTSFNNSVDCVVVGDIEENLNGSAIRKASQLGVPVYKESQFFDEYDIDKDMAANLK